MVSIVTEPSVFVTEGTDNWKLESIGDPGLSEFKCTPPTRSLEKHGSLQWRIGNTARDDVCEQYCVCTAAEEQI